MFYIPNKIDYNKIHINYIYKKKVYKLYYNLDDNIKLIGVPIVLKYDSIKVKYNLYYIYFKYNYNLQSINNYIFSMTNINIIKYNYKNNSYYIICKNINNNIIEKDSVNINISKIIYINNKCVPLIYII